MKTEADNKMHVKKADEEMNTKEASLVPPCVTLVEQEGHTQVNTEGGGDKRQWKLHA